MNKKMKSKRAQQEIIVTVLLVLIAIAAIVLISNFVINMVKTKTTEGNNALTCTSIDFTVARATSTWTNITLTRGAKGSDINITNAKVLVNGAVANDTTGTWSVLTSRVVPLTTGALKSGDKITVAPILGNGAGCDPMAETTVA
jgi:multidrug resistance efflux pump